MRNAQRTNWLVRAVVIVCTAALAAHGAGAQNQRPTSERLNILLITADDLNGDSMGWMGSKLGATPNIDRFAEGCHRLEQQHVSVPICQPSRSAFMTGRVPHRNGALGFHPIRRDVTTFPEVLRANGYFTCAINKTAHMAPRDKFDWDLPLEGSGKNPPALAAHVRQALKTAAERGASFFINANITDPHRPFAGSEQGRVSPRARPDQGEVTPFTEAQITVPSFLEELPQIRKEAAEYYSSVRRFDLSFKEILAALEESGQAGKTAVVFMSDHGMSFPFSKASVYRNGTWAPLLIRWPGMDSTKRLRKELVSSVDLMPTLLELLAIKAPPGMDGRSWLPLLRGERQPGRDFVITHVNTVSSGKSFPQRCVRTLTRSYMFHAWSDGATQFRVEAMNGLTWRALQAAGEQAPRIGARAKQFLYGTREMYFDLEKDHDERRNLIDDPSYRKEIETARQRLLVHMETTEDPLLPEYKKIR